MLGQCGRSSCADATGRRVKAQHDASDSPEAAENEHQSQMCIFQQAAGCRCRRKNFCACSQCDATCPCVLLAMADADIDSLSLKELKALITEAGLSFADCIDKTDLRTRAKEAQEKLKAAPAPKPAAAPSGGFSQTTKTLGGYECIVNTPAEMLSGGTAELVVVMLHGLGASNSDLVAAGAMLGQYEPALASKKIIWVFPQAPMTMIGAAWWTLDVMSFMTLLGNPAGKDDQIAKLIREEPPGLAECRTRMASLVAEAKKLAGGVPSSRLAS